MTSILKRTLVLSFSRFANQAIVLLSPMLLVRILSVAEYGRYREFLVYAGLVGPLVSFGIARSLPFLLPKHPEKERVWVTQTMLYVFAFTSVAIIGIFIAGDLIRAKSSYDFVTALQLYIIFFINLDFIELYWLAKKRTDYVLYYTSGRLLVRTIVVVVVAFLSESTIWIIYSLVVLEAVRCFLVFCYALYRKWFTSRLTRESLKLQLSYFLPLGSGAVVEAVNSSAGLLFVSAAIGAEALAFYTIGMFARMIVEIMRGSVADVIFPDIVELKTAARRDALPLWQRATVWYCIMLFPVAVIFSYYSDAIVTVLFTSDYLAAVPVFATFAFMLYVDCFDFHLPLRVQNANRFFFIGSVIALIANLVLIYPMYVMFGLLGPAVAFIISRLAITTYLASGALTIYGVKIRELVLWREIGVIFLASILCVPILIAGKAFVDQLLVRGIVFGGAYMVAYLLALRLLGVQDVTAISRALVRLVQR